MQVYRNSLNPTVNLAIPANLNLVSVDALAIDGQGRVLHEFATVAVAQGSLRVTIPWTLVREDRDLYIDWTVAYVENTVTEVLREKTEVQVVTPILSLDEIRNITGWDDEGDIEDLERRVRFAIQANTGTTFGKFRGTIPIMGSGDSKLNLPLPILEVEKPRALRVYGGGWMLGAPSGAYQGGIKTAPPEDVLDRFYASAGPITAPFNYSRVYFADDVAYSVTGLWGYHDVPADVQQAARLLVTDYSCDESLWRDRYINAIRAGDWRIDFNGEAFQGTGNVVADQILAAYRRTSLVVI